MDSSCRNLSTLQILFLCFVFTSLSVYSTILNNHKLIYTHCSNQSSQNPSHSPLLSNLFQQFITQSSRSSSFKTIVGDEKIAISGLFQCRNDLTSDECTSCVRKLHVLSKDLCSENIPARIQLSGCYAHYQEEDGAEMETNTSPDQLMHRDCSTQKIKKRFEEMKYAAFAALENCVVSGEGFCETTYESVHVLAECGGSLRKCGCGECVSNAVEIASEDVCRYSVSGEVYLDSCFISFDYYNPSFGSFLDEGNRSVKLVAIAVGGLAVLLIGIGLCCFLRSCGKKDDW